MKPIKVAVIGIGNCASSLVQGIAHYRQSNSIAGLIREYVGGYAVGDIEIVLGVDVDRRKVGRDVAEAIFAAPNNTVQMRTRAVSAIHFMAGFTFGKDFFACARIRGSEELIK